MIRAVLMMLAIALAGCGQTEPEPEPAFPYFSEEGGRVRDMANVLSPTTESALTKELDRAQAEWGPALVVVTVPSLHGMTIEDFSLEYARAWRIGDAHRHDGLQLLVAPNERKVRIEVGTGLERSFDDAYCQTVIDRILPLFRAGDFDGGVETAIAELVQHMRAHPTIPANDNSVAVKDKAA